MATQFFNLISRFTIGVIKYKTSNLVHRVQSFQTRDHQLFLKLRNE